MLHGPHTCNAAKISDEYTVLVKGHKEVEADIPSIGCSEEDGQDGVGRTGRATAATTIHSCLLNTPFIDCCALDTVIDWLSNSQCRGVIHADL
jgi:hypothetical protein